MKLKSQLLVPNCYSLIATFKVNRTDKKKYYKYAYLDSLLLIEVFFLDSIPNQMVAVTSHNFPVAAILTSRRTICNSWHRYAVT